MFIGHWYKSNPDRVESAFIDGGFIIRWFVGEPLTKSPYGNFHPKTP